jgi:hypothetical protein
MLTLTLARNKRSLKLIPTFNIRTSDIHSAGRYSPFCTYLTLQDAFDPARETKPIKSALYIFSRTHVIHALFR